MTQSIQTPSPPPPPGAKRKVPVVAIVAVVVVIIASVGVYHYLATNEVSSHGVVYHVGVPSASQVNSLTGVPLTKHPMPSSNSTSITSGYDVISSAFGYYLGNTSNESSNYLGFASIEFSNASEAGSYYVKLYSEESLAVSTVTHSVNGTYDNFSYFTVSIQISSSLSTSGPYVFIAAGHAGQYVFMIIDDNVPLTNTTALIHDQIGAMESPSSYSLP